MRRQQRTTGGSCLPPAEIQTPGLFQEAAQRHEEYRERLGLAMVTTLNFAKQIAESDVFEGDKQTAISNLKETLSKLVALDAETSARSNICASMRHDLVREQQYGEAAVKELEKYDAELKAKSHLWSDPATISQHRHMREIDAHLAAVSGADDDVVIGGSIPSTQRCPISGGPMEKPVVNTVCGHSYSTAGIIAYLCQLNPRERRAKIVAVEDLPISYVANCPNAGCRSQVSRATLDRDYAREASQRLATRGSRSGIDEEEALDADTAEVGNDHTQIE